MEMLAKISPWTWWYAAAIFGGNNSFYFSQRFYTVFKKQSFGRTIQNLNYYGCYSFLGAAWLNCLLL
jgi:hypothetical protein